MNPLLLITAIAIANPGQVDPLALPIPSVWYADLRDAEVQVATLLRPALTPGGPEDSVQDSRPALAMARARRIALQRKEQELRQAREELLGRIQNLELRAAARASAGAELEAAVATTQAATARARAEACQALVGAPRRVLKAHAAWEASYAQLDWRAALEQDDGLGALHQAGARLKAEMGGWPDGPQGAIADLLLALNQEIAARMELRRHLLAAEAPSGEHERARAELEDLQATLVVVAHELLAARDDETALAREVEAQSGADNASDPLVWLDATYARLQVQVEELDAPVDASMWCALWVHGGLTRIARGEPGGEELLARAAIAREDVCRPVIEPWLDLMPAQVAWVDARFRATEGAPITLLIEAEGGRWWVDGLPVYGVGVVTLELRPGLHRIEFDRSDGQIFTLVEEVDPGERLGIWATEAQIVFAPLAPGEASARPSLPPRERVVVVQPQTTPVVEEPRDARLSSGVSARRIPRIDDHLGVGAALLVPLRQGPHLALAFEGRGELDRRLNAQKDYELWEGVEDFPWLPVVQLGVRLAPSADRTITPWISGYGDLFLVAASGVGGAIGAELHLSRQLGLEAAFGADLVWHGVGDRWLTATQASLYITRWQ